MNEKARFMIAGELLKAADEIAPTPMFAKIDKMNMTQLIDYLKKNQSKLQTMSLVTKMVKFGDVVDLSTPLRGMKVVDVLRTIAKICEHLKTEQEGQQDEQNS